MHMCCMQVLLLFMRCLYFAMAIDVLDSFVRMVRHHGTMARCPSPPA